MRYCGHFFIKGEGGAKNYKCEHPLPLGWRSFTVAFVQPKGYYIFQNEKKFHLKSRISFVSQTEEEMCCRQQKSYGGELVTQIFMILGYYNFSIRVLPVV